MANDFLSKISIKMLIKFQNLVNFDYYDTIFQKFRRKVSNLVNFFIIFQYFNRIYFPKISKLAKSHKMSFKKNHIKLILLVSSIKKPIKSLLVLSSHLRFNLRRHKHEEEE